MHHFKFKGRFTLLLVAFLLSAVYMPQRVAAQENEDNELKAISQREAKKRLRLFNYKQSDFKFLERKLVKSTDLYDLEEIVIEIDDPLVRYGKYKQNYIYYNVKTDDKKPVVIVSRPLQNKQVDRLVANSFAKLGYSSLLVVPPESLVDPELSFEEYNEVLVRYTITMSMTVDFLQTFEEIDPEKIYAYGISMGGIRTALAFEVDKRIKKSIVIVGGGDLPGVLVDSYYPVVQRALRKRMKRENVESEEELKSVLYDYLSVDPLHFAFLREPEDILFVLGNNDMFVRDKYQLKLYNAFARPKQDRYPQKIQSSYGHVLTVYFLKDYAEEFVNFVETGSISQYKQSPLPYRRLFKIN